MIRSIVIVGFILMSVQTSYSQMSEVRQKQFNTKKNLGLEGYDPVSYFESKPVEGKSEIQWTYQGITYRFSSAQHLSDFKISPSKYEPAYGGWCAYAMGQNGEKVKVDPETYKILDGKLYLFYNFWGNNTLTDWNKNEKVLKARGDDNWKKFVP
jgi:YHS domain-containing protein